jgi:hypothetical protein
MEETSVFCRPDLIDLHSAVAEHRPLAEEDPAETELLIGKQGFFGCGGLAHISFDHSGAAFAAFSPATA